MNPALPKILKQNIKEGWGINKKGRAG